MKGKKLIASGNYCKTSYFTATGVAEYTIGVKDTGEDECAIYLEDGLYKLYRNGELLRAATSVLINVVND